MNAVDKKDEESGGTVPTKQRILTLDLLTFNCTLHDNSDCPGTLFTHIISDTENFPAKGASAATINGEAQKSV